MFTKLYPQSENVNVQVNYLKSFGNECLERISQISKQFRTYQTVGTQNTSVETILSSVRNALNAYELLSYQIFDSCKICDIEDLGHAIIKMQIQMQSMLKWILNKYAQNKANYQQQIAKSAGSCQSSQQKICAYCENVKINKGTRLSDELINFREKEIKKFYLQNLAKDIDNQLDQHAKQCLFSQQENLMAQNADTHQQAKQSLQNRNASDTGMLLEQSVTYFERKNQYLKRFIQNYEDKGSMEDQAHDNYGGKLVSDSFIGNISTAFKSKPELQQKLERICLKVGIQAGRRMKQSQLSAEKDKQGGCGLEKGSDAHKEKQLNVDKDKQVGIGKQGGASRQMGIGKQLGTGKQGSVDSRKDERQSSRIEKNSTLIEVDWAKKQSKRVKKLLHQLHCEKQKSKKLAKHIHELEESSNNVKPIRQADQLNKGQLSKAEHQLEGPSFQLINKSDQQFGEENIGNIPSIDEMSCFRQRKYNHLRRSIRGKEKSKFCITPKKIDENNRSSINGESGVDDLPQKQYVLVHKIIDMAVNSPTLGESEIQVPKKYRIWSKVTSLSCSASQTHKENFLASSIIGEQSEFKENKPSTGINHVPVQGSDSIHMQLNSNKQGPTYNALNPMDQLNQATETNQSAQMGRQIMNNKFLHQKGDEKVFTNLLVNGKLVYKLRTRCGISKVGRLQPMRTESSDNSQKTDQIEQAVGCVNRSMVPLQEQQMLQWQDYIAPKILSISQMCLKTIFLTVDNAKNIQILQLSENMMSRKVSAKVPRRNRETFKSCSENSNGIFSSMELSRKVLKTIKLDSKRFRNRLLLIRYPYSCVFKVNEKKWKFDLENEKNLTALEICGYIRKIMNIHHQCQTFPHSNYMLEDFSAGNFCHHMLMLWMFFGFQVKLTMCPQLSHNNG